MAPFKGPAPMPAKPDNLTAMSWALVSVIATAALTLFMRAGMDTLDSRYVVFLRFAGSLAILAPLFVITAKRPITLTRPWLHITRGALFCASAHLGFYAVAHLELVTATILMFTAPLFATALGALFLGQRVGLRRSAALLVGFFGVILILRPASEPISLAMLAALGSAFLFGAALIMSGPLSRADGTLLTILSACAITAILSIPIAAPVAVWPLAPALMLIVAAMILAGLTRMVADIRAYSAGDAAAIAPIAYLRLIFIGLGGYIFWNEVPNLLDLIGAAIIIAAALYVARREAHLKRAGQS